MEGKPKGARQRRKKTLPADRRELKGIEHIVPDAPGESLLTIEAVLADLATRQGQITDLLAQGLATPDQDRNFLTKLLELHGQNASRLGRLLRDQRALSGQAADGIAGAIAAALDELATELDSPL